MTGIKQKKTITSKTKTNNRAIHQQDEYGIRKGIWLPLALGVLTIYSLYIVAWRISGMNYTPNFLNPFIFLDPSISSLLIVILGSLFFYKTGKHTTIPQTTKVAARILVAISLLTLGTTFVLSSMSCGATCSDDFYFRFSVLFHNSYISGILSLVAIVGIVAFLINTKKRDKKS